jgi:thioredoxin 1
MENKTYELIDFFAEWCGPCVAMKPVLAKLEAEMTGKFTVKRIDVDHNEQMASQYGVMGIPTFVIQKDGKEIARKSGAMPYEIFKSWVTSALAA